MKREYQFKFYLNASHYVDINDKTSTLHPHTFEITILCENLGGSFIPFYFIENDIKLYLSIYENKILNKVPPFDVIVPAVENIAEVFFKHIKNLLEEKNWRLNSLELSENPTRVYRIINNNPSNLKPKPILNINDSREENEDEINYHFIQTEINELEEQVKDIIPHFDEISADLHQEIENNIQTNSKNFEYNLYVKIDDNKDNFKQDETYINYAYVKRKQRRAKNKREHINFNKKYKGKLNLFKNSSNLIFWLMVIIILGVIYYFTFLSLTSKGIEPWGSDTWGHLYKSQMLYEHCKNRDYFPIFTYNWYNGIQPFRYWAPLPYYIILVFLILSKGNIYFAFYAFLAFVLIIGGIGWVIIGTKLKKKWLGLIFSILWFFNVDNLRVLFAEGNLPRVVVAIIFPYLLLGIIDFLINKNKNGLIIIFVSMFLTTLSHLMITAMVGITIFILLLNYSITRKTIKEASVILVTAVLGILLAGFWIYPALKGGIMSLDPEATKEVTAALTYPITQSLNPFYRLRQADAYYFGLSFFVISLFGVIFSYKESRGGFFVVLLIFLGTTKFLLPIIMKLPMAQLFWAMRFTPLAMGVCYISIMLWEKLNRIVLILFLILITIEGLFTFKIVGFSLQQHRTADAINFATKVSNNRVAILDLSMFDSYPSYWVTYNSFKKPLNQVYGWAWQGATTAPNIVAINTSLEKKWYHFMFDRCLEMGADTLVVNKNLVEKELDEFSIIAWQFNYNLLYRDKEALVYRLTVPFTFGTIPSYEGIAIGKYASNLAYIFPKLEISKTWFIDDFSYDKLKKYKLIYLSGFKFHDKKRAERMILDLSKNGVKVIVDLTGVDVDILSSRTIFLDVIAHPIKFINKFPPIEFNNKKYYLNAFPEEYSEWNTHYIENLDNVLAFSMFDNKSLVVVGNKYNSNIIFISLNIPFYALVTKDINALRILQEVIGLKINETPMREIVELKIKAGYRNINILSRKAGVLIPLADLDAFKVEKGLKSTVHNLVLSNTEFLRLKIIYPYLKTGIIITIIDIIIVFLWRNFLIKKGVVT